MRIIGVTGTIGAGKSTVLRWLAELGAYGVDADALVHRLYASDRTLQAQLRERFGASVVSAAGVDRQALSRAVFGNPEALAALEGLVHPAVHRAEDEEIARARAAGAPAYAMEAIRLVESGGSSRCDELWIVVAAEAVQLARLAARGVSEDEARRRLAVQGSVASWTSTFQAESARLGRPRPILVVDNSGSEAAGRAQVERLWRGLVAR
jgi:dephospho-CoA kinase